MRTRISEKGITEVWDPQRHKWVKLTPEEEVRQRFVEMLVTDYGYPQSVIGNEVAITVGQINRRCDSVVFGKDVKPLMIIEYKAPSVQITQKVFNQILRYDMTLHVKWLVVTNGKKCYCVKIRVPQESRPLNLEQQLSSQFPQQQESQLFQTEQSQQEPMFEFVPAIPRYQEL